MVGYLSVNSFGSPNGGRQAYDGFKRPCFWLALTLKALHFRPAWLSSKGLYPAKSPGQKLGRLKPALGFNKDMHSISTYY